MNLIDRIHQDRENYENLCKKLKLKPIPYGKPFYTHFLKLKEKS